MRSSRARSTTRRKYANNRIETDHGRLKSRVPSVRGLKTDRSACVIVAGHTFMQNLRRAHYELGQKLAGTSAPKQHSPTRSNQPRSPAPTQRLLFGVGCTVFVTTITAVFLVEEIARWLRRATADGNR